ncbi:MAG: helix-turn-helix domain-containing protein [Owenweeksia sp.]
MPQKSEVFKRLVNASGNYAYAKRNNTLVSFMTTQLNEYFFELNTPGEHTLHFPTFAREVKGYCPVAASCILRCWEGEDLLCIHTEVQSPGSAPLQTSWSSEAIALTFMLDGKVEVISSPNMAGVQLAHGEHNIYRTNTFERKLMLRPGKDSFRMLSVLLPVEAFKSLLHPAYDSHNSMIYRLEQGNSGFLLDKNLTVSPALAQLLDTFQQPPSDPALQYLFFKSRILELLMLQLEQVDQSFCRQFRDDCEMARMKPLLLAKQILEEQLINPPHIPELAKMAGTNEYDLKRNFKETWGHTIFGYVTELRMKKAWHYLEKEGKTVSETAHLVGYKNPQHFTVAFKKKFGILPSSLL